MNVKDVLKEVVTSAAVGAELPAKRKGDSCDSNIIRNKFVDGDEEKSRKKKKKKKKVVKEETMDGNINPVIEKDLEQIEKEDSKKDKENDNLVSKEAKTALKNKGKEQVEIPDVIINRIKRKAGKDADFLLSGLKDQGETNQWKPGDETKKPA